MTRWHCLPLVLSIAAASCTSTPAHDTTDTTSEGSGVDDTSSSSTSSAPGADTSSTGDPAPHDADSSSSESSTGDIAPTCTLPAGSPPATVVDTYLVEPIDALSVHVVLAFDASTESATGVAELRFRTGPEGGLPAFDLRQEITALRLDGMDLEADAAPEFSPTEQAGATMRVLNAALEPCSEHTLEIDYGVVRPPDASFPIYDPAGVLWHSDFIDLLPGGYAERWMPANLPHDELDMVVEVQVLGTLAPHTLIANGEVDDQGDGRWTIAFPPHFSALSPFIAVAPTELTEYATEAVMLPDGHAVTIEIMRLPSESAEMADLVAQAVVGLSDANLELGEYPHGDRYQIFASGLIGGMEFPGATASAPFAIPHEAFHSWIARGMRPLRHRDGWIDEAWTSYAVDLAYDAEPLGPRSPESTMSPDDPWLRATPISAYMVGPNMLAMFAETVGVDALRGILREFYVAHAGEFVTTEELHAHLAAGIGAEIVDSAFDRFVTGMPE